MYRVEIRNNETGEIQLDPNEYDFEFSRFWWEEGNMACDCNRQLLWNRIMGVPESDEEFDNAVCGDGRFSVRIPGLVEEWI